MHIPKTAGMTLQTIVRNQYAKPGEVVMAYGKESRDNGFVEGPKLQAVMGHYRFGYHKFSKKDFEYCTFLRNPLDHLLSNFNFTFDFPEKYPNLGGSNSDLLTFTKGPYGYNFQTRFISGIDDIKGKEKEALALAKSNLENHFGCIGLTEDFDTSLYMLGKHLGWRHFYFETKNKGKTRKKNNAIDADVIEKARKINKYDEELYLYAQELYQKQKSHYSSLSLKVKFFQFSNQWFWRLNPSYTKLKVTLGLAR